MQLYISISGDPSNAMAALSQCLEAVMVWMGEQQSSAKPWQDVVTVWVQEISGSVYHLKVWMGLHYPCYT